MIKDFYHSSSHCKYLAQYHIVWCTKYRYPILKGNIEYILKAVLLDVCVECGYYIKALEIMPDHIHLFVDCPQTIAPCDIVRIIKSKSAICMFKQSKKLKLFYARCGSLWSSGYFISTVGHVSEDIIKQYIEEQKDK